MRRLKFSPVLILSIILICLFSCRQSAQKQSKKLGIFLIEEIGGNTAKTLTTSFSTKFIAENLENFSKSELKLLAKQIKNNSDLVNFIGKNPQTIKTWRILSNTDFGSKPSVIKHFDELSISKELSLVSDNGIPKIIRKNNKEVLAEVTSNKIIITNINNNPVGNIESLAPNSLYKVDNIEYLTDASSRIKKMEKPLIHKININNLEENTFFPLNFGGSTLGVNKNLISKNSLNKLFQDWNSALSKNEKIHDVRITSIYKNTTSKIAEGFNVSYIKNKKRVYSYFPNQYNQQCKEVFDEMNQSVIGKHIKTNRNRNAPVFKLSKDVSLIENKLIYEGNEFGKIDPVTKIIYIDRRKALSKDGLNPILSHPKLARNYTYNVKDGNNMFKYKTDNKGVVSEIEGDIVDEIRYKRVSVGSERTKTKQVKDEISSRNSNLTLDNKQHQKLSDEAGHFIADIFGGIPEVINMFPQAFKLNRGSKWKKMEIAIKKAVSNGDKVSVKFKAIYDGMSKRPSELICEYTINGEKILKRFENTNFTLAEIL